MGRIYGLTVVEAKERQQSGMIFRCLTQNTWLDDMAIIFLVELMDSVRFHPVIIADSPYTPLFLT